MPAQDPLALREQVAERVRQGLLPALGSAAGKGAGTRPQDAAAYDLFLRSVALARDPEPNRIAAELLEKAVAIDPGIRPGPG